MLLKVTYPLFQSNTKASNKPANTPQRIWDKKYSNNFASYDSALASVCRAQISFKGYFGDPQPAKKLFYMLTGRNEIYEDNWTKDHLFYANDKKWVSANPAELLKRTPEQAVQSICTITKSENQYPHIPSYIQSPNYGDNWGRFANYIEINPRAIAKYDGDRISEGLLETMKLLPAIPPASKKGANCLILSQLYPSISNDGNIYDGSLYCANLHSGISKNLTSEGLYGKMGEDEQVKAFNDLAHLMGFKTGFRMPLSAGQLKIQGNDFNWYDHEKAYIDACIWGIELGFDSIYFDSGKHVVDYDGYSGQGAMPNDKQFAYILYEIRNKTGRSDLSFIGEKCNNNYRYKEIGLTAGTDWGKPDNIESIKYESRRQAYSREYAAGPEVSNDNDYGELSFETRLNRLNSCLWGFDNEADKLPMYMQLHDFFPLSPYTNTHELMMSPKKMSGSDAWTDCEKHWDGIFNTANAAENYTNAVYEMFANSIRY